jgi:hypothetical protein
LGHCALMEEKLEAERKGDPPQLSEAGGHWGWG